MLVDGRNRNRGTPMSDLAKPETRPGPAALGALVESHPAAAFFTFTYLYSWLFRAPAALAYGGALGEEEEAGNDATSSLVELYWIPLGAGSPLVQASGRVFERLSAWRDHRERCDLYHGALQVQSPQGRFAIEQAPVPDHNGGTRGVVAEGPVGLRLAGRLRVFRYEVRCWPDGIIPDIGFAVDSPIRVSTETRVATRILELLPSVPTPVWGRDEAGTGEMWNSNSIMSWVLTLSGVDTDNLNPPSGGRAPGWAAGRMVALGAGPPPAALGRIS
jgi:hypothetical protein